MSTLPSVSLLVIGDCATDRAIYRRWLEPDTLSIDQIVEVEAIAQATDWCQQQTPDLILLNLPPSDDGLEYLDELRKVVSYSESAIIVVSDRADRETAIRVMQHGAHDCLVKADLTSESLQHAIRRTIEQQLASQRLEQIRTQRHREQTPLTDVSELRSLQRFVKYAPVSIAMLDRELRYIMASQRWIDDYHLSSIEAITGRSHYDIFPEIPEHWRHIHQRCLAGAIEHCDEELLERADGSHQWLRWAVHPWYMSDREIGGIIIFSEDITERRQSAAALQESEERLRLALMAANQGIYDINVQTGDVIINPSYATTLEDELVTFQESAAHRMERLHPDDRDAASQLYQAYIAGEIPEYKTEYRLCTRRGDWKWILSQGKITVWDEHGQPLRMLGTHTDISDRKQAELALAQLASIVESSTDAIISKTLDGVIVSWNAGAESLFGYTAAEVIGQSILLLIPAELISEESYILEKIKRGDRIEHYETVRRCKDGRLIDISLTISPIRDEIGRIVGISKIARDLSIRKQAEAERLQAEKLRLELQLLENILEVTLAGYWDWNIPDNQQYLSPTLKRMFGYGDSQDGFTTWQELIFPDDLPGVMQSFQQHVEHRGQRPFYHEVRYRHKDGSTVWAVCSGRVIEWDQDDNPLRMIGCHFDTTPHKRAEASLQRAYDELSQQTARLEQVNQALQNTLEELQIVEEELHAQNEELSHTQLLSELERQRYQNLFNFAPDGYVVTDGNGTIQEANRAIASLIGTDQNCLINTPLAICISDPDRRAFRDLITQLHQQSHPEKLQTDALSLKPRQGDPIPVAMTVAAIHNDCHEITSLRWLIRDITERQQAAEQLRLSSDRLSLLNVELARAVRLKDEFLANMSHELRTPLNAILGISEGLQEDIFGLLSDRQREAIATIERSGSHLLELINDILDLSKIESGKLELDISTVAIRSLCDASLTFVRQAALKKKINLQRLIPDAIGSIQADERRLRQALINLLSNAIKFTPDGGSVTLDVKYQSALQDNETLQDREEVACSWLVFSVMDTGIGIDSNNMSKLFQPFVQIDSRLNRQYEGTGLGLSLVRRIAELHGGDVTVSSEPGRGSCFTLRIPDYACPVSEVGLPSDASVLTDQQPATPTAVVAPERSPLILVAEDNAANVETLSAYLSSRSYRLILAADGQEAIDLTKAEHPDLILMDIQMPGTDGLEAIRQIRAIPEFARIPIVAFTALAMADDREKCLAAGATKYLTKPVSLKQVVMLIQQLLNEASL